MTLIFPNNERVIDFDDDGQPLLKHTPPHVVVRAMHTFLGICKGIAADGSINEREMEFLRVWMQANRRFFDSPAAEMLFQTVWEALPDAEKLYQHIRLVIGKDIVEWNENAVLDESAHSFSTEAVFTHPVPVIRPGMRCLVTGKFFYGSRSECRKVMEDRGLVWNGDNVTLSLDLLVIGGISSKQWTYESYGNKVAKALRFNKEYGNRIAIVSEEDWIESMLNLPIINLS